MKRSALLIALVWLWAVPQGYAWVQPQVAPPVAPSESLAAGVRARVVREMAEQGLVGLSIALADHQSIIHSAGFGFQDRENKVPVSPSTMYRWASVSKPLTAIVALQLSKEGRLDLNKDVRSYVPEFPEKPHPITARQLLCHQGGIVHYSNGVVLRTKRTYSQEHPFEEVVLALDTFKESPLVAEPGTKYSYTTHGYMLLGAVAERAGEAPYWHLVRDRIVTPLKMSTLQPDYQWVDIPHRTKGYVRAKGTPQDPSPPATNSTDTDVSWKLPGGGFTSVVDDMALLGIGLLGETLLDAETRLEAWTPQATVDGKQTTYGLGFGVDENDGRLVVSHSGSQEKTATLLCILPTEASGPVVVAIMCNTEGAKLGPLAHDLARLVIESRTQAPVSGEGATGGD